MNCRDNIRKALEECRTGTLKMFENMDALVLCKQVHPEFSPPGWHLGHIGYTEALWVLQRMGGYGPVFPQYHQLFAADGLPKHLRQELPSFAEICDYLKTVREKILFYLETAPVEEQERLWWFLVQHECQHCETIAFVTFLSYWQSQKIVSGEGISLFEAKPSEMIKIKVGSFEMGSNAIDALDNERPQHSVFLDTYWIDRYPVTCGEYAKFIEAGGYQKAEFWSEKGWKWLQENPVSQPLYWNPISGNENYPVCGVSWYEADAYARFVNKRLPTEAEWEKAASWDEEIGKSRIYPWGDIFPDKQRCNLAFGENFTEKYLSSVGSFPAGSSFWGCEDMLGNVWEWTSSWFDGYEGFEWYPYRGYSQVYFDGLHRVLKGGSWATRPQAIRCSFRNWYDPGIRCILAGFRCAKSE